MIKAAAIMINGKIYTDDRHFRIIPVALKDNPNIGLITQEMQGFVTDDGKFVDREEAAKIAYECGQIKEPKNTLFSEDIF